MRWPSTYLPLAPTLSILMCIHPEIVHSLYVRLYGPSISPNPEPCECGFLYSLAYLNAGISRKQTLIRQPNKHPVYIYIVTTNLSIFQMHISPSPPWMCLLAKIGVSQAANSECLSHRNWNANHSAEPVNVIHRAGGWDLGLGFEGVNIGSSRTENDSMVFSWS